MLKMVLFYSYFPPVSGVYCCSVAKSCPIIFNPMLQHARLLCPPLPPRVSFPLSQWCYLTTSSSVIPFSFYLQSFPASGSFPMSQLFASSGASASALVLSLNLQGWFPLGLTGLISCSPKYSQESSVAPQFESLNSLVLSLLYGPILSSIHDYWIVPSLPPSPPRWPSSILLYPHWHLACCSPCSFVWLCPNWIDFPPESCLSVFLCFTFLFKYHLTCEALPE